MRIFIEQQILTAIQKLLSGRVNEIILDWQEVIPVIEFGNYKSNSVVVPVVTLANCEQTEKERIVKLDVYSLSITFSFDDVDESEMFCYAYSAAVAKAVDENPTLGGIADRVVITGKKYQQPKNGDGWSVTLVLRLTIEELKI